MHIAMRDGNVRQFWNFTLLAKISRSSNITVFKTYDMHSRTKILLLTCRIDLSDSIDTNFTSMRPRISELHVIEH